LLARYARLADRGKGKSFTRERFTLAPVGEHSVKPDEAFKRIERLYPGPYLELFARQPREGWTVWGNEIGNNTMTPSENPAGLV
jgi:N6-adenosine-specific RNA methylase IME4